MRTQTRDLAEREAKIDALHQKLTDAVGALVTGDDWRRALEFAARFRSRSFNNTLLIFSQHNAAYQEGRVPGPVPTYVAGFKQWLSLNRHVMKGQGGYAILAPVTARFASTTPENPDSWRRLGRGEKPQWGESVRSRMIGLKPAHVWDISQTDGEPVPEPPRPQLLEGEAPEGLWDGLADQIVARGFELRLVSNARSIGGANGLTDYLTHEVSVRMDMDDAAQVKTLAHELGHVMLHGPDNVDAAMHRGIAEVEAESIALMVGAAHGLDTTTYTVPYVSTWASDVPGKSPVEVVQATADRVRAASLTILDNLPTTKVGDGNPPGLDRDALSSAAGSTVTSRRTGSNPRRCPRALTMLNNTAPYRRDDHGTLKVPVVMPLVEVVVNDDGYLDIRLDREPYTPDGTVTRRDLASDREVDRRRPRRAGAGRSPRVRRQHLHRHRHSQATATEQRAADQVPAATATNGFLPDEEVSVAVILGRHRTESTRWRTASRPLCWQLTEATSYCWGEPREPSG